MRKGLPAELRSSLKLADLSLILFSGRPVIALVNHAVLQAAGLTPEKFDGPHYLVVVGMDVEQAFIHDPLRKDASGQAQGIPWLIFTRPGRQAQGYERAILVRVCNGPAGAILPRTCSMFTRSRMPMPAGGDGKPGELFEITTQQNGWGKIGEGRSINLALCRGNLSPIFCEGKKRTWRLKHRLLVFAEAP